MNILVKNLHEYHLLKFSVIDVNRKSDIYQKDENTLTQFQSVLGKSVEHISAIKSFKHVNEVLQFLESNPIDPNLYASIFSVLLQLQQSGK